MWIAALVLKVMLRTLILAYKISLLLLFRTLYKYFVVQRWLGRILFILRLRSSCCFLVDRSEGFLLGLDHSFAFIVGPHVSLSFAEVLIVFVLHIDFLHGILPLILVLHVIVGIDLSFHLLYLRLQLVLVVLRQVVTLLCVGVGVAAIIDVVVLKRLDDVVVWRLALRCFLFGTITFLFRADTDLCSSFSFIKHVLQ